MRYTEFWRRMDEVLGPDYSRSWAADISITELDSATVSEALAAGVPARQIWRAVCRTLDVPRHLR